MDNNEDIIDSRDVIARIAELESYTENADDISEDYAGDLDDDDHAELLLLRALAAEGEDLADWEYGATLIRDSHFTEYAQELAEDCGVIDPNGAWPVYCIDWEWAARELKMDYTAINFGGVTYWGRA